MASLPAVQDVNLIDGVITNGQLSFTGSLYLYYGRIDASLNFTGTTAQSVYKWQSTGTVTTITGVGANTVVLASPSNSSGLTTPAYVSSARWKSTGRWDAQA